MDILAHGLWATAAGKVASPKLATPPKLRWVFFWGIFPDLFAFGPMFVVMLWYRFFTDVPIARGPHGPPTLGASLPSLLQPELLYNFSHSLFVFSLVFGLVWILLGRPAWVFLGWVLHIVMDIPTHSLDFYPTPFLWPLSSYLFDGIRWGQLWFITLNYSALATVFLWLLLLAMRRRRKMRRQTGADGVESLLL